MNSKREIWLDYVKAIGIILVVAGHCNLPEGITNYIYLFHMPLFFFISGYLFPRKIKSSKEFLKKKAKRLLYPYFVCGVLIIIWNTIRHHSLSNNLSFLLLKRVVALIYGNYIFENNVDYIGTLWFLVALFCVCIMFIPYAKFKKAALKLLYLFFIVSAGFIICMLEGDLSFRSPWCFEIGMVGFFFSICGYEYRNNDIFVLLNNNVVSILITILGFILGKINLLYMSFNGFVLLRTDMLLLNYGLIPLFLLSALCICIGICNLYRQIILSCENIIKKRHIKVLNINFRPFCFMGRNSLLIMMFHIYIIECIVFFHLFSSEWIVFVLAVILSAILAYIIRKFVPFIYDMDKLGFRRSTTLNE